MPVFKTQANPTQAQDMDVEVLKTFQQMQAITSKMNELVLSAKKTGQLDFSFFDKLIGYANQLTELCNKLPTEKFGKNLGVESDDFGNFFITAMVQLPGQLQDLKSRIMAYQKQPDAALLVGQSQMDTFYSIREVIMQSNEYVDLSIAYMGIPKKDFEAVKNFRKEYSPSDFPGNKFKSTDPSVVLQMSPSLLAFLERCSKSNIDKFHVYGSIATAFSQASIADWKIALKNLDKSETDRFIRNPKGSEINPNRPEYGIVCLSWDKAIKAIDDIGGEVYHASMPTVVLPEFTVVRRLWYKPWMDAVPLLGTSHRAERAIGNFAEGHIWRGLEYSLYTIVSAVFDIATVASVYGGAARLGKLMGLIKAVETEGVFLEAGQVVKASRAVAKELKVVAREITLAEKELNYAVAMNDNAGVLKLTEEIKNLNESKTQLTLLSTEINNLSTRIKEAAQVQKQITKAEKNVKNFIKADEDPTKLTKLGDEIKGYNDQIDLVINPDLKILKKSAETQMQVVNNLARPNVNKIYVPTAPSVFSSRYVQKLPSIIKDLSYDDFIKTIQDGSIVMKADNKSKIFLSANDKDIIGKITNGNFRPIKFRGANRFVIGKDINGNYSLYDYGQWASKHAQAGRQFGVTAWNVPTNIGTSISGIERSRYAQNLPNLTDKPLSFDVFINTIQDGSKVLQVDKKSKIFLSANDKDIIRKITNGNYCKIKFKGSQHFVVERDANGLYSLYDNSQWTSRYAQTGRQFVVTAWNTSNTIDKAMSGIESPVLYLKHPDGNLFRINKELFKLPEFKTGKNLWVETLSTAKEPAKIGNLSLEKYPWLNKPVKGVTTGISGAISVASFTAEGGLWAGEKLLKTGAWAAKAATAPLAFVARESDVVTVVVAFGARRLMERGDRAFFGEDIEEKTVLVGQKVAFAFDQKYAGKQVLIYDETSGKKYPAKIGEGGIAYFTPALGKHKYLVTLQDAGFVKRAVTHPYAVVINTINPAEAGKWDKIEGPSVQVTPSGDVTLTFPQNYGAALININGNGKSINTSLASNGTQVIALPPGSYEFNFPSQRAYGSFKVAADSSTINVPAADSSQADSTATNIVQLPLLTQDMKTALADIKGVKAASPEMKNLAEALLAADPSKTINIKGVEVDPTEALNQFMANFNDKAQKKYDKPLGKSYASLQKMLQ